MPDPPTSWRKPSRQSKTVESSKVPGRGKSQAGVVFVLVRARVTGLPRKTNRSVRFVSVCSRNKRKISNQFTKVRSANNNC